MEGCRPVQFPVKQQHHLGDAAGNSCTDPGKHRRLIGKLLYLTIARPGITYVVNLLSQFMKDPQEEHLQAGMRALKCLKESPGKGVLFPAENDLRLAGFCEC